MPVGDRFLSGAGTGKNCALSLSMRSPDRSPVLDKNHAPMGPEILSSAGAGVCRKAPTAFPDSSSVLDKFQSLSLTEACPAVQDSSVLTYVHTCSWLRQATCSNFKQGQVKRQNTPA